MMHSKSIFLLLALLTNCIVLQAKQLTAVQALQRMQNVSYAKGKRVPKGNLLSLAYICQSKAGNIYYAYNDTVSGGDMLLAADDKAPAILAKVNSGRFDLADMPENARRWLDDMSRNIELAIQHDIALFSSENASEGRRNVEPLLLSKWSQDAPYNNLCPKYTSSKKSASGCVATAMAQLMYFHRWPIKGVGEHSYTSETHRFDISADFASSTYLWDQMQNYYGRTYIDGSRNSTMIDYSQEAGDAVATLLYDCGVSVDMDYGESSGAFSSAVGHALTTYFSYDKALNLQSRIWYSDDDWEEMLYQELAAGRPTYYSATSDEGGHAFVCDGYEDGYYHFNWGWSGIADGYYLITGVDPMHPVLQDTKEHFAASFNRNHNAIFGMQKESSGKVAPLQIGVDSNCNIEILSLDNNPVSHAEKDATLRIRCVGSAFFNFSNEPISVFLGVKFEEVSTGQTYWTLTSNKFSLDFKRGYTLYTFFTNGIPEGTYRVNPVFSVSKDTPIDMNLPYGFEKPLLTIGNATPPDPEPDPDPDPDPNPGDIGDDTDISIYPNTVYFHSTSCRVGECFVLPFNMKNEEEITSFQFDIKLPEGVSFVRDEYGDVDIELSGDRTNNRRHNIGSKLQDDGSLRIICYSSQNSVFSGNDGVVLNMPLNVAETMPSGRCQIELSNIRLATPSLQEFVVPQIKTSIDVKSWTLGDVTGDDVVDVVDLTALVSLIVGTGDESKLNREAADVYHDGILNVVDVTALVNIILKKE